VIDTAAQTGSSQPGCLRYGLLIAFSIVVILAVGIGYFVIWRHQASVEYYTVVEFSPVKSASVSSDSVLGIEAKLDELVKAYEDNSPATVVISAEELAALPSAKQFPAELRQRLALRLEGSTVAAEFSFKLRDLSLGFAEIIQGKRLDRYATGQLRAQLTMVNDTPRITLAELSLAHKNLEDMALKGAQEWFQGALESLIASDPRLAGRILRAEASAEGVLIQLRSLP
jgi:hypothetical protein